jgi:type II secretory pathway component PulJ
MMKPHYTGNTWYRQPVQWLGLAGCALLLALSIAALVQHHRHQRLVHAYAQQWIVHERETQRQAELRQNLEAYAVLIQRYTQQREAGNPGDHRVP